MKKPLQVDPVRAAADPKGAALDALTARLHEAVIRWDELEATGLVPAEKAMMIARALHGVSLSWPFCYALVGLLLDEDRQTAFARFHLKGGRA